MVSSRTGPWTRRLQSVFGLLRGITSIDYLHHHLTITVECLFVKMTHCSGIFSIRCPRSTPCFLSDRKILTT
ncbi:hypothetical protein F4814DRAFT_418576 [Daldinia grandis]|nr:hypothetical protein F4814DRAFT_418576 [Daldinia grandis]